MAKTETKKTVKTKIVITEGAITRSEQKVGTEIKRVATLNKPDTKLARTIIEKAAKARELDSMIKVLQAELKEIKEFFMTELKDKKLDFLYAEGYKVCYSKSESLGFDKDSFLEKYADLYDAYKTKLTTSEKVVINMGR